MIRRAGWLAIPLGENMIKINLWAVYVLGYSIDFISSEAFPISGGRDTWFSLWRAKKTLEDFTDDNPLQFSQTTHRALMEFKAEVEKGVGLFQSDPPILRMDMEAFDPAMMEYGGQLGDIHRSAKQFETAFSHECQELNTFYVPQKGTHQTAFLMKSAVDNLSADVRSRLSRDAINDINSAGRCLALDVPTASGFHMLRAVEALMRDYYYKLTGTTLPVKSRNWGAFIKALDKNGADIKVTGFLTHIKDFYRNPIVHPEEVLSIDEAFSLFNASLSAITMLDAAINVP